MAVINGNPLRIAWDNYVEYPATTITATNENSALPVANVKSQLPTKVYRSTSVSSPITVSFDFGTARSVQQFALKNHNFTSSATITLNGANNSGFSPIGATISLIHAEDLILGEFSATQSYRYWRVVTTDVTNSDGYLEMGHMFLGPYTEFGFPNHATVLRTVDPAVATFAFNGSSFFRNREKYTVVEFGLDMVQQVERRSLSSIYDTVGVSQGVYLFLDPDSVRDDEDAPTGLDGLHRFTYYGVFLGEYSINHVAIDWHSINTLGFRELI